MLGQYRNEVNRITLYITWDAAFRNYYYDDRGTIPGATGSDRNSNIVFLSNNPCIATIDWGDGVTEQYGFTLSTNGYYVLSFRSLDIDFLKNPADTTKGWNLGRDADGNYIVPYPNYIYGDGDKTKAREITIEFSSMIYSISSVFLKWNSFPLLEFSNLKRLQISYSAYITTIPIDRLSKMSGLEALILSELGGRISILPTALFNIASLKKLGLSACVDLTNAEASNIRDVGKLSNLESIDISNCYLKPYIKEFNDLKNLQYLYCSNFGVPDVSPDFSEVSQINQKLTVFDCMSSALYRNVWANLENKQIQNLTELSVYNCKDISIDIPNWLTQMRSLAKLDCSLILQTQTRADEFVSNFYTLITSWDRLTMNNAAGDGLRNQFYGLSVIIYSAAYPRDYRPLGAYQEPSGFIEGVSNGTPTSPMEIIFVLTKNYKQNWTVKP